MSIDGAHRSHRPHIEAALHHELEDDAQRKQSLQGGAQVPMGLQIEGATGSVRIGSALEANMQLVTDVLGRSTTVRDSVCSTIPGAPANVGKASTLKVNAPGFDIGMKDHGALASMVRFAAWRMPRRAKLSLRMQASAMPYKRPARCE